MRALVLTVLLSTSAGAQDLMELLSKGPVVLVEMDSKGKFDKATAVVHIKRPPEEVWKVAVDFPRHKEFMPKLLKSDVTKVDDDTFDLDAEIEVPGVNPSYTFRYDVDAEKRTIKGQWLKGDIKGSHCLWRLVPYQGGTLLYYTNASRNFSSLAEGIEDDQQTVTVGVNVTTALAVVKAVKTRVESASAQAAK